MTPDILSKIDQDKNNDIATEELQTKLESGFFDDETNMNALALALSAGSNMADDFLAELSKLSDNDKTKALQESLLNRMNAGGHDREVYSKAMGYLAQLSSGNIAEVLNNARTNSTNHDALFVALQQYPAIRRGIETINANSNDSDILQIQQGWTQSDYVVASLYISEFYLSHTRKDNPSIDDIKTQITEYHTLQQLKASKTSAWKNASLAQITTMTQTMMTSDSTETVALWQGLCNHPMIVLLESLSPEYREVFLANAKPQEKAILQLYLHERLRKQEQQTNQKSLYELLSPFVQGGNIADDSTLSLGLEMYYESCHAQSKETGIYKDIETMRQTENQKWALLQIGAIYKNILEHQKVSFALFRQKDDEFATHARKIEKLLAMAQNTTDPKALGAIMEAIMDPITERPKPPVGNSDIVSPDYAAQLARYNTTIVMKQAFTDPTKLETHFASREGAESLVVDYLAMMRKIDAKDDWFSKLGILRTMESGEAALGFLNQGLEEMNFPTKKLNEAEKIQVASLEQGLATVEQIFQEPLLSEFLNTIVAPQQKTETVWHGNSTGTETTTVLDSSQIESFLKTHKIPLQNDFGEKIAQKIANGMKAFFDQEQALEKTYAAQIAKSNPNLSDKEKAELVNNSIQMHKGAMAAQLGQRILVDAVLSGHGNLVAKLRKEDNTACKKLNIYADVMGVGKGDLADETINTISMTTQALIQEIIIAVASFGVAGISARLASGAFKIAGKSISSSACRACETILKGLTYMETGAVLRTTISDQVNGRESFKTSFLAEQTWENALGSVAMMKILEVMQSVAVLNKIQSMSDKIRIADIRANPALISFLAEEGIMNTSDFLINRIFGKGDLTWKDFAQNLAMGLVFEKNAIKMRNLENTYEGSYDKANFGLLLSQVKRMETIRTKRETGFFGLRHELEDDNLGNPQHYRNIQLLTNIPNIDTLLERAVKNDITQFKKELDNFDETVYGSQFIQRNKLIKAVRNIKKIPTKYEKYKTQLFSEMKSMIEKKISITTDDGYKRELNTILKLIQSQ